MHWVEPNLGRGGLRPVLLTRAPNSRSQLVISTSWRGSLSPLLCAYAVC
jgi:hypothetical protein